MCDWPIYTLEQIADRSKNAIVGGPFGSDLVSADYRETGVPVIRGENVSNGRWVSGPFARVSDEKADKLSSNLARSGDVIFTQRGANHFKQIAIVPDNGEARYLVSQSQMKLTVNREVADRLFIYYCFRDAHQQEYLQTNAISTGVPHTNLGILKSVPLALPPLPEQRRIASLLGALDDKIELNRRMNATLEEMARGLFRSWFVDFDPVHARAAGEAPAGLSPETAALFPDRFAEDGLPVGWEERPIGDLTDIAGGATPSTKTAEYWDGDLLWATPKDLSKLTAPVIFDTARKLTAAGVAKISSGQLPAGTLLLSSRAPIGYLAIAQRPVSVNQGFIAFRPGAALPNTFMLFWCKENMETIVANANGSTFQEISKRNFRPIPAICPTPDVLSAFIAQADPLLRRLALNEEESRTLAELRDALLPRLMSGELRVREAEELTEALL